MAQLLKVICDLGASRITVGNMFIPFHPSGVATLKMLTVLMLLCYTYLYFISPSFRFSYTFSIVSPCSNSSLYFTDITLISHKGDIVGNEGDIIGNEGDIVEMRVISWKPW